MPTTYENILLERDGAIATITINRPKALNALNDDTIGDLDAAIDEISATPEVRGLIITGAGSKAFVAGADISRMPEMSPKDAATFSRRGSDVFRKLERLPIPVLAAVNGFALGGGCELMLSCDFAYAAENARFGQPEVNLGIIAGFGGTQRLMRKIPYGMAIELLMNAEMIKADEALRIGLVNKVVPADELLAVAKKGLSKILARGPVAVALSKQAAQDGLDAGLEHGLELESKLFGRAFDTADAKEGVAAFLGKRAPEFTGK